MRADSPLSSLSVRRYTKHSRNKAQEIQGAVLPMAETFAWDKPFLGAFLAGRFTGGSLTQLRSLGFSVVHVSYEDYLAAFKAYGIDIAFDEDTDDARFTECLTQIAAGGAKLQADVLAHLARSNRAEIDAFLSKLRKKLMRHPIGITIVTLFGTTHDFADMKAAVDFVRTHQPAVGDGTFRGFEVIVKYSNDDRIDGFFKESDEVRKFLEYAAS